jgi:dolichol-phosphate mannosyltransferase
MLQKISLVIPVYNEADNIPPLLENLSAVLPDTYCSEIVFVDDGSTDQTLNILKQTVQNHLSVRYISLSRNFGHQNALKAGIDMVQGDCVITMDGDLQHPPQLIPLMLSKWKEGYDVVYTRRHDDTNQAALKQKTSQWFYKCMHCLSGLPMEQGLADFRLIDRRVANILTAFHEPDLFLRGVIKWMGFRQFALDYTPGKRFSGSSKYSSKKMIKLALQGVTSFSVKPLYASIIIGIIFSSLALLYIPYVIWCVWIGKAVVGWASIVVSIMFFGGLQMMILGIIGIYIGKIFIQTKQRPGYIVKETNIEKVIL